MIGTGPEVPWYRLKSHGPHSFGATSCPCCDRVQHGTGSLSLLMLTPNYFRRSVAVSKFGGASEDRDGRQNATHELDGVKLDCERDKFGMQSFHLDATTEVRVA